MSRKEIDLHSELLELLKNKKIIGEADSWGSAGPDFYIKGKAVIEVKRSDSDAAIKEAYKEVFDRKKKEWLPSNLHYFGIITPKQIQIYQKHESGYNKCHEPDLKFSYPKERDQFIALLKGDKTKIEIGLFLKEVLEELYQSPKVEHLAVIRMLLHFDKKISFRKKGIFLNQDSDNEVDVECGAETVAYAKNLYQKYFTEEIETIKDEIRHNWSHYQIDSKKSSLGKYYTPKHLVDLIKKYADEYLEENQKAWVLDSCAGCGSFLEAFKEYNIIGRDFDKEAVEILKELGYQNIAVDNSLVNSNREKYEIENEDKLVIVGNPPYNDVSSKNKRFGTDRKINQEIAIDEELKSKDYGMAFLKHYASLSPQVIVVLHPLSYLIKEPNFKKLGSFRENYRLESGVIFSSSEFGDAIKGHKTQFPIVCAKYVQGDMNFDFIKNFQFDIFNDKTKFSIKKIYTIDDYGIRKYPPSMNMVKESDIGLYHYNIRDTNSLKTSGNLCSDSNEHTITVQFEDLYKYAYLNCYRRYFSPHFLLGNVSPVCSKKLLDDQEFRDICIMDTIIENQRLAAFDLKNTDSILQKKFVLNDFRRKAKQGHQLYKDFIQFVDKGANVRANFRKYFEGHFKTLLKNSLR